VRQIVWSISQQGKRPLNVLLVTIGSSGDVHPFVGLGIALRERGHQVTLVTSSYFRPLAEKAGLAFVDPLPDYDFVAALNNRDIWHPLRGFGVIMRLAVLPSVRPTYRLIAERYVPGETVVVASSLALGARIAQERLGVPTVSVHLSPSLFRSVHETPQLTPHRMPPWLPVPLKRFQYWLADVYADRVLAGEINAFRGELGLPAAKRIIDQWWHSPERILALFPDWFAAPQPDWPPQTVLAGFPLYDERGIVEPSPALQKFLAAGRPPVVFTPGSANLHAREFFAAAIDACRRIGRRAILLTRFPEQLPSDLPESVLHADFVPFGWLLPQAAAVVHHGGVGSTAQGLACGVPQLLMAMAFDQFDNAERVRKLGVGDWLRPSRFTAPAVAEKLARLIGNPEVASRCHDIKQKFAGHDTLAIMCREIEAVGAAHPAQPSTAPIH
jgi:UDP:flavonoid glycosyltransferase YjiC (YdhE family)